MEIWIKELNRAFSVKSELQLLESSIQFARFDVSPMCTFQNDMFQQIFSRKSLFFQSRETKIVRKTDRRELKKTLKYLPLYLYLEQIYDFCFNFSRPFKKKSATGITPKLHRDMQKIKLLSEPPEQFDHEKIQTVKYESTNSKSKTQKPPSANNNAFLVP